MFDDGAARRGEAGEAGRGLSPVRQADGGNVKSAATLLGAHLSEFYGI
jgi:hypothetical protein